MRNLVRRFHRDDSGATAIEYGLIAALITLAIIVAMTATGTSLKTLFNYTSDRATAVWNNAGTS
jgi:pilus assembly protein Flp/PilA